MPRHKTAAISSAWKLVAQHPEQPWTLYQYAQVDGWIDFVLRHDDERFRKYSYWGGWNGQRFARKTDMQRLVNQHPEIYQWLEATCRQTWQRGIVI
jgi:hypothetical protein